MFSIKHFARPFPTLPARFDLSFAAKPAHRISADRPSAEPARCTVSFSAKPTRCNPHFASPRQVARSYAGMDRDLFPGTKQTRDPTSNASRCSYTTHPTHRLGIPSSMHSRGKLTACTATTTPRACMASSCPIRVPIVAFRARTRTTLGRARM